MLTSGIPLLAEQEQRWDILVPAIGILVILIALSVYFGKRWPRCQRKRALHKTGVKEKAGLFKWKSEEWKCKYCGHTEWKDEPEDYD